MTEERLRGSSGAPGRRPCPRPSETGSHETLSILRIPHLSRRPKAAESTVYDHGPTAGDDGDALRRALVSDRRGGARRSRTVVARCSRRHDRAAARRAHRTPDRCLAGAVPSLVVAAAVAYGRRGRHTALTGSAARAGKHDVLQGPGRHRTELAARGHHAGGWPSRIRAALRQRLRGARRGRHGGRRGRVPDCG